VLDVFSRERIVFLIFPLTPTLSAEVGYPITAILRIPWRILTCVLQPEQARISAHRPGEL